MNDTSILQCTGKYDCKFGPFFIALESSVKVMTFMVNLLSEL